LLDEEVTGIQEEPRCPIDSMPCGRPHLKDLGFPGACSVDMGEAWGTVWRCQRFREDYFKPKRKSGLIGFLHKALRRLSMLLH
jgi:hypothetical protein